MQSRSTVIRRFEAEGISVAEWSRNNGYKVRTVRAVIYGDLKCKRGVSHKIAVALGIKPDVNAAK